MLLLGRSLPASAKRHHQWKRSARQDEAGKTILQRAQFLVKQKSRVVSNNGFMMKWHIGAGTVFRHTGSAETKRKEEVEALRFSFYVVFIV